MNSREYFQKVQEAILSTPHVIQTNLLFDQISDQECYIKGKLTLTGGMELHIAEYVLTEPDIKRLKYRFHLQTIDHQFIARWDNAPHHKDVETHPHHFHEPQNIKPPPHGYCWCIGTGHPISRSRVT